MRAVALFLPLILASCAADEPRSPVRDAGYSAIGENPFWMVAIGDDAIVLTRSDGEGRLTHRDYPRLLPRTVDGARVWQSGTGADAITIIALRGPCQSAAQAGSRYVHNYEHHVAVSVGEGKTEELRGCGGRILERVERR